MRGVGSTLGHRGGGGGGIKFAFKNIITHHVELHFVETYFAFVFCFCFFFSVYK